MIIIGVDTGLFTGMAYWDTKIMEKPNAIEVPYAETGVSLFKWLYSVNARADVHVACEKYVMTPGSVLTPQPEALMGMGVVEYLCKEAGRPLTWQSPRDAKHLISDAVLRQLGWFVKTKDGHANDGMRHLLTWYARNYPQDFAGMVGM